MKHLGFTAAVFFAFLFCRPAAASHFNCPFCSEERGPTLMGDFNLAQLVMVGTMANAKLGSNGIEDSTTDFIIENVIKAHPIIEGKKQVQLPRYVQPTKNKFLIFCEIYKKNIDPYRGVEVQSDSQMVKYLSGAVTLKEKSPGDRLRYCFDFLNNPEFEVAIDAYREFAKADYKEYRDMAKSLPADTIAGWLDDPKTPPFRYGLYASLLGHCGSAKHADVLRKLIHDPEKNRSSGIDGMMAGLVMLQPKEGWADLNKIIADPKQDFNLRYAVLRTIRFIWEQRPDLVNQKELVGSLAQFLTHADMADFAVEDLRKYQRWEMTGTVLEYFGKKTHSIPVIKRAILRFMLQSPEPRAKEFVAQQRQRDNEWVRDAEELLKLEAPIEQKK